MTTNSEISQKLVFFGQLLVRGVAVACILFATVTLVTPSYVILESWKLTVVIPVAYLVGEEYARGWFFVQTAVILFHLSVERAARMNRIRFVMIATILTLTRFAREYPFTLNLGVLEEWFPLLRELTRGSVTVPVALLFSIAVILWGIGLLVDRGFTIDLWPKTGEWSLLEWLDQHRWLVVARLSGYTLAVACVVAGLAGIVDLPLVPTVWYRATPGFLLFGVAVYGFVSTEYVSGTAILAGGAWITGLASLQYDSAVPGVVLPAAVLLTIAAVAGVFSNRRAVVST
jgi:hypothetical protein